MLCLDYMYVCVYIYIYIYTHTRISTHKNVHLMQVRVVACPRQHRAHKPWGGVCVYIHIDTKIHILHTHTHAHLMKCEWLVQGSSVLISSWKCLCVYINTYTTHTQTNKQTNKQTHMHT